MKNYRHLIFGLLICSVYFINSLFIKLGINTYINYLLNHRSTQQIVDYLLTNSQAINSGVNYYSLVFMTMFWVYMLVIIMIVVVHRNKLIAKCIQVVSSWKQVIIKLIGYAGTLLALSIIIYIINLLLFPAMKDIVGDNQSVIDIVILNNPNIYIFTVVVILSPIIEEYIFRYGLINNLLKYRNKFTQVIVSALIFSFIHIGFEQLGVSPTYFGHLLLLYMPMAVVYSYVYVQERNIVYPLALHILNNIGSIIIILLFK